jgi:group II intron reverse transcriptase/maturase
MPVTAMKKTLKRDMLRHAEYYDLTATFDKLYADSKSGAVFTNLVEIISSGDNILLAYRELKRNKGSMTAGTDNLTIRDIEKMPTEEFVRAVQKKLDRYKPRPVKRVEIPKDNGKIRPLGIPSIWDRIVQQCILQVLEPICEAKFHERSNGFRPNRSTEHAIAQCMRMIQVQDLHFVVDIDIEGFFDNVNHAKLRKQMWSMGIRDKSLLCIVTKMLKAPIVLHDGDVVYPEKGTPQGGVLSPLLSNIVLNELDWWIASQWETMPMPSVPPNYNTNGGRNRGNENKAMRKTALKEMYLVRYADDFKIFCRKRSDANKAYLATKKWLTKRLKLTVNDEKSKVVNLKKSYTDFLGFKLKAVPGGGKHKVRSHMSDKAYRKTHYLLKSLIRDIQNPQSQQEAHKAINRFNAAVIGKHQYYRIATCVYEDFDRIAFSVNRTMKNRLKGRLKKVGKCRRGYIWDTYGKSGQFRYVDGYPVVPIAYIQTKNAMHMKRGTCNYTSEGRALIHKPLGVDLSILKALMLEDSHGCALEYLDNRISLYAAQYGKCAVTGKHLSKDEIHCHHKTPKYYGGDDRYENLVIVHRDVHSLIHAKTQEAIDKYMCLAQPNVEQLKKLNKLRLLARLPEIETA